MTNWDIDYAREYHELSKHWPETAQRLRSISPSLIPRNHKLYVDLPSVRLPEPNRTSAEALASIAGDRPAVRNEPLDLATLSSLLHFSAGVIRRTQIAGRTLEFRAAACTGACYHIDLYVVSGDMAGLPAGVYQYGVHNESLIRLRQGDFRAAVLEAMCQASAPDASQAYIVFTSTFWRNTWRYEDRAYRHAFWDSGTIVANLLALAAAHGLAASLLLGFVDEELNALIDVDGVNEAALGVIALGRTASLPPQAGAIERLGLATVLLSPVQIEYPAIARMHEASSVASCEAVERWRAGASGKNLSSPLDAVATPSSDAIESVIERRGSARRFKREPIERDQLIQLLDLASSPIQADFLGGRGDTLVEPYLILNAVEGLNAGAYGYAIHNRELELLRTADFRTEAGHLALNQQLAADAAVNLYFLADLEDVLPRFGNRGCRAAQLEGGIRGGRVYLAAYAVGLRATGLTFYDDEVIDFFGPAAAGKRVMFLIAVGR